MWKRVLQIWERGREGCTQNSGSTTGMINFSVAIRELGAEKKKKKKDDC
jgi:hypothetical protein